jgi:hypothetical protein
VTDEGAEEEALVNPPLAHESPTKPIQSARDHERSDSPTPDLDPELTAESGAEDNSRLIDELTRKRDMYMKLASETDEKVRALTQTSSQSSQRTPTPSKKSSTSLNRTDAITEIYARI